jgi:hypothetical protein
MERYRNDSGNKTVLALCFSTRRETFHHWKIFSGGSAGVCIEIDRDKLFGSLTSLPVNRGARFRTGRVSYRPITVVEDSTPPLRRWPFIKRLPFRDEGEVRVVYQNRQVSEKTRDIPLNLDWIIRVTLSPWMPKEVAKSVVKVVRSIEGCKKLSVSRSHLLETARWRRVIEGPLPRDD